jgi:hypothetical protein
MNKKNRSKMRSKLLVLGLLLGFLSSTCYVNAQKTTYEYKYLYTVAANGEKYKRSFSQLVWLNYITFKDNAETLYISDKDGYNTACGPAGALNYYGSFEGENNGMQIYREYAIFYDVYCNPKAPAYMDNYFYFSSDFSHLNIKSSKSDETDVYERHILEHPKQLY